MQRCRVGMVAILGTLLFCAPFFSDPLPALSTASQQPQLLSTHTTVDLRVASTVKHTSAIPPLYAFAPACARSASNVFAALCAPTAAKHSARLRLMEMLEPRITMDIRLLDRNRGHMNHAPPNTWLA